MIQTTNLNSTEERLKKAIQQAAVSTFSTPILIAIFFFSLNFFHDDGNLDFSTCYWVVFAFALCSMSDFFDYYTRLRSPHPIDFISVAKKLKTFKHRSPVPSLSILKQLAMISLTITILSDLASKYLIESVIVDSIPAQEINEIALMVSLIATIVIAVASIVSQPSHHDVGIQNVKLELLLVATLLLLGLTSIININKNYAVVQFENHVKNQKDSRNIRVSHTITGDYLPSELLAPTIYGNEQLAAKLLSSLHADDFKKHPDLARVIAQALYANAHINIEADKKAQTKHRRFPNATQYHAKDESVLRMFIEGDIQGFTKESVKIIQESSLQTAPNGSYAVSLLLHLIDAEFIQVNGIQPNTKSRASTEIEAETRGQDIEKLLELHEFLTQPDTKYHVDNLKNK
ncbi:hypothetical protein [Photobacterium galatheae]|uniref:Uncharacterized protein n=1 Tax=Photobacterium galatheae TaxID=1654360 RepID=A0A066RUC3_9GAMM|nr:hypothetical protein [Photobacterium galatheae]KDM90993.1 hypothetical protein EA58_14675 [Photobacterium galatheae]MCM0149051.1 hypothetical protein [Photobacterium galatheae]